MLGLRKRNRRRFEAAGPVRSRPSWPRVAGFGVMFLGAAAAGYAAIFALDQPIRIISVEGKFQRVSPVRVEQAVTEVLDSGFLTADLAAIRRNVEGIPWVDQARVKRRWPDGLRIEVTEQIAAARWGESGLLNTRGELFIREARHVPPELPRLSGPAGSEWQVAQRYLSAQGRLLEAGLRLTAVELDARGAWELELANGVSVRLGRREVEQRLGRFVDTAMPLLAGRGRDIAYIDMRYSNGFAIGWKKNAGREKSGALAGGRPVPLRGREPPRRSTA